MKSPRSEFLSALLIVSLLVAPHAGAQPTVPGEPAQPAAPPPVTEQLPPMVADGQELKCIQTLLQQRDHARWKAAKRKYAESSPRQFPHKAWGILAWTLTGVLGAQIVATLAEAPERGWLAALAIPVAAYLADWFSALYHKFVDSFAGENHPWWGAIARDFRIHHEDPNLITEATYWDRMAANGKPLAPVLAGTIALLHGNVISPELATGIWSFFLLGMHGAAFHQYAHTKNPPVLVGLLQSMRLALQREAHMRHHRAPFDETFGVVNGWSEPLARSLDLWRRLDRLYWKYTRRMPGNWIQDPRSIPDEVVAELREDFERIPHELWGYSLTVFPNRVPEELKDPVARVQARWRTEFIELRKREYREVAIHDRQVAERLWRKELEEFAWIYGPNFFPFDEAPNEGN
jgi:ubiquitin-conjugating enzyme E2 variant